MSLSSSIPPDTAAAKLSLLLIIKVDNLTIVSIVTDININGHNC